MVLVVEGLGAPTSGQSLAARGPAPRLLTLSRAGAWMILAMMLVAMAPTVGRILSLGAWTVDSRQTYWSYRDGDSFPVHTALADRFRDLRTLPTTSPAQLQVTTLFQVRPERTGRLALIAPAAEGEILVFVNGVATRETPVATGRYLALPGARPRLWEISPNLLRPGLNRIDLILNGATGRSLRANLVLGPAAGLAPAFRAGGIATGRMRSAVMVLSLLACGLALAAALAGGAARPWVAVSAVAGAIGARTLAGEGLPGWPFGGHGPVVDQILLAMALVCLGCAAPGTGRTPSRAEGRVLAWGTVALLALALLAWFAAGPGSGVASTALLLLSTGFLAWAWRRRATGPGDGPAAMQPFTRLATGLAVFTVVAALAGASGQLWGLWTLGLDAAYGLGVVILLGGLAIVSAWTAARAAWRRFERRLDLGHTIRRQQAEIQATSAALEQEMRRSAILEERQRLARDMHDGIGGQLVSLLARVRTGRISLDQMEGELSGGLSELRLLVDSLDTVGESLADALAAFRARARTQADAAGLTLVWDQPEDIDIALLDPRWILNLYRLMQETVTNAARHSGGDTLCVRITRRGERDLTITVEDNGSGYDPEAIIPGRGLANMAIRADQLAARLTLGPATGPSGARVRIDLTVPQGRAATIGQSRGEITPS